MRRHLCHLPISGAQFVSDLKTSGFAPPTSPVRQIFNGPVLDFFDALAKSILAEEEAHQ